MDSKIPLAFFLIMGLAVMTYLFLTGAFLTGTEAEAWENALAKPLEDVGIQIENFALFVAVSIIFGLTILIPLTIQILRMMS